jgi:hypothetical protein
MYLHKILPVFNINKIWISQSTYDDKVTIKQQIMFTDTIGFYPVIYKLKRRKFYLDLLTKNFITSSSVPTNGPGDMVLSPAIAAANSPACCMPAPFLMRW